MNSQKNKSIPAAKYIPSETLDPCVHCGFCLPTCASYRVLGTEMDSPRGRIHSLKAIQRGELQIDETVTQHFDTCLGCFACVTACPSGVRYDKLIEGIRPLLNQENLRDPCKNILRKVLLNVLPYPKRLRAILFTLRSYSGSNLQKIFRQVGLTALLGKSLEEIEALMPPLIEESFSDNFPIINPAQGLFRGRVGLILGCVQRCFDPQVNHATVRVLQANGFEVIVPSQQGCCGAVTHHQGQTEATVQLGKALVRSFSDLDKTKDGLTIGPIDAVLVAAAGCGHTLKSYEELLGNENNFKVPIFDVHEFLTKKGLQTSFLESLKPLPNTTGRSLINKELFEVAYHDACHMIHGQNITKEPRELLKSIPNLCIYEPQEIGVCCGSAGIYNLIQPNEAKKLGKEKVNDLTQTGAKTIVSANIGCTLQIRRHLNNKLSVKHPMQLLAESAGIYNPPSIG